VVFLDTLVSRLSESSLYVVAFVDVKAGSVEARRLFLDYDESNQIEQVIRKLANLQPHGLIPVWLLTNSPGTVRPMWKGFFIVFISGSPLSSQLLQKNRSSLQANSLTLARKPAPSDST
jgi:hypothetical protein